LELAASRATFFSAEQAAKRLDDRFKLLTGGSRTALPRQQTLRALIDWSYDLLSEDERALLRRLSVFAGGWTFEAAETICNNVDVFEHLPQLVNKSLVTVKDINDEPRYFLLETIRQYARDKLLEADEGEGTRNRHLAYFLEMAETARPELLRGKNEVEWIERLSTEYDNIRTAIEWGLTNDPFDVLRMIASLGQFWLITNFSIEGHRLGSAALKQVNALTNLTDEQLAIKARGIAGLAFLSFSLGDTVRSGVEAEEAIPLLRKVDDKWLLAIGLSFLALAKLQTGDIETAFKASSEMQMLAVELDDPYIRGVVLAGASLLEAIARKDPVKVIAMREEAEKLTRENGSRWSYATTLHGSGNFYAGLKQFDKAREKYKVAMHIMQELGSSRIVIMLKSDLAHILRHEGNFAEAIPAYHETIKEWQRMGHRAAIAHQLESLAFIAKAMEQTERAARLFGAAEALRKKIRIDMTTQERQEYDKEISDLKANMDKEEFASLWAEGRSMTMNEAIDLALDKERK